MIVDNIKTAGVHSSTAKVMWESTINGGGISLPQDYVVSTTKDMEFGTVRNDSPWTGFSISGADSGTPWPDPPQKPQNPTGRKFDTGKPRYGLLPPLALLENVKVLTFGARKYEPDNWKHVDDGPARYFDAAMRHMWAYNSGEIFDPETDLHHLAHAICCLQFITDIDLTTKE